MVVAALVSDRGQTGAPPVPTAPPVDPTPAIGGVTIAVIADVQLPPSRTRSSCGRRSCVDFTGRRRHWLRYRAEVLVEGLAADRDGGVATDVVARVARRLDRGRRRARRSARRIRPARVGPSRRDPAVRRHQSARHGAVSARRSQRGAAAGDVHSRTGHAVGATRSSRACSCRSSAAGRSTRSTSRRRRSTSCATSSCRRPCPSRRRTSSDRRRRSTWSNRLRRRPRVGDGRPRRRRRRGVSRLRRLRRSSASSRCSRRRCSRPTGRRFADGGRPAGRALSALHDDLRRLRDGRRRVGDSRRAGGVRREAVRAASRGPVRSTAARSMAASASIAGPAIIALFGSVLVHREWSADDPRVARTDVSLVGSIDRTFARDRYLARAFAVVNPGDGSGFVRGLLVWSGARQSRRGSVGRRVSRHRRRHDQPLQRPRFSVRAAAIQFLGDGPVFHSFGRFGDRPRRVARPVPETPETVENRPVPMLIRGEQSEPADGPGQQHLAARRRRARR